MSSSYVTFAPAIESIANTYAEVYRNLRWNQYCSGSVLDDGIIEINTTLFPFGGSSIYINTDNEDQYEKGLAIIACLDIKHKIFSVTLE